MFEKAAELSRSSQVRLHTSCNDLDDMDVYVIRRKPGRDGSTLLNYIFMFEHQEPGTTADMIPDEKMRTSTNMLDQVDDCVLQSVLLRQKSLDII
jgi:hypothetical protein